MQIILFQNFHSILIYFAHIEVIASWDIESQKKENFLNLTSWLVEPRSAVFRRNERNIVGI